MPPTQKPIRPPKPIIQAAQLKQIAPVDTSPLARAGTRSASTVFQYRFNAAEAAAVTAELPEELAVVPQDPRLVRLHGLLAESKYDTVILEVDPQDTVTCNQGRTRRGVGPAAAQQ